MKQLLKRIDKGIKNYTWIDIGQIKWAMFFFTLFLITV